MDIRCQVRSYSASSLLLCAVGVVASSSLACLPAFGEAADATSSASQGDGLETIIVTAERRSVDLQLAPVQATVLTGEDLSIRNINAVDQLQFFSPSLTVQSSGVNSLINIRGIGKSDAGAQVSSGVLIYRDGVSTTPNGLISDEPYYDIANVEVYRGPQGTFAGQNATGGAIYINEANPTLDRFGGWVEAQYGNYNDFRVRAAVNIPLSETFAIRLATDSESRDTFFNLSGPNTGNPGNLRSTNWRLSALFQPSDAFTAVLKADYNYINHGGSPAAPFNGVTDHIFDVASDSYLSGYEKQYRIVLHLDYKFANDVTLKSITGYQDGRLSYSLDADGTATPPPAGVSPEIFVAQARDITTSEEINLVSSDKGPFTWVTGAVYQNDNLNTPQFILSLAPGGTTTSSIALNALWDLAVRDTWGVFAQGGYAFNDKFKMQAGLRYSETTFTANAISEILFFGTPLATSSLLNAKQSDSKVTGKVNFDYALDPQNFLYAFVATGHKGGGINAAGPVFGPEDVVDYELGWKANFLGDRIRTQIGGFYSNYHDFQIPIFVPTLGMALDQNAAGTTVIKGIEAQMQAALGGWSFDLGGSYVHSALGQFTPIDSRNILAGPQDVTGNRLPNAPTWTAQAGVQYTFNLASHQTLTPRVDYGLVGQRWTTVFQVSPGDNLPSQNIFNAQLLYSPNDSWKITAYATNLFDLHYVATAFLGNLGFAGPPRQFGIRANWTF
jgi:iron complex outermembrane receptor protein